MERLNENMANFYSSVETRNDYQAMVDTGDNELESEGIVTNAFISYLKTLTFRSILEVGCGSGRIFQFLNKHFKGISYTGIELSEKVIEQNRIKYPDQKWHVAGVYNMPVDEESVDVCFSFYVLEHLVFPERAISEMMRTVKKGGYLILIFPDFVTTGRLASQTLGFSDWPQQKKSLKKGIF
jgi:ubiquinone/menaquinone biosynthesis C-methylase UbiE